MNVSEMRDAWMFVYKGYTVDWQAHAVSEHQTDKYRLLS